MVRTELPPVGRRLRVILGWSYRLGGLALAQAAQPFYFGDCLAHPMGGDSPANPVTPFIIARVGVAVLRRSIVLLHQRRQQQYP